MKFRRSGILHLVLFLACVAGGIYLQGGWLALYLDYRAPALILFAFVFLLLLLGGTRGGAQAYFDAYTHEAFDDRLERYLGDLSLVRKAGRLLFLWGALGALLGYFVLVNNIDENGLIGSAIYFSLSSLWLTLVFRAVLVHPTLGALEAKIATVRVGRGQNTPRPQVGTRPWVYLLLLFVLPVISILFFLIAGADVRIFVIPGAALFAPFAAAFACAMGVGFEKMGAAFRVALGGATSSSSGIGQSILILRRCASIALEMGALGFVTKLIVMLAVIEDPTAILGQFSLSLVPVFYGIYVAAAICLPLAHRLEMIQVATDR